MVVMDGERQREKEGAFTLLVGNGISGFTIQLSPAKPAGDQQQPLLE